MVYFNSTFYLASKVGVRSLVIFFWELSFDLFLSV